MSDDTKHAPQHYNFISLEEDYQIDYWTREICGDARSPGGGHRPGWALRRCARKISESRLIVRCAPTF